MPGEPREHRKRCHRYNEPYHAHHLTFSCYRRQPFLSGPRGPRWFLEALDAARRIEGFHLWAYVIMPEHVHLVIAPGERYDISRILWRIKTPVARRAVRFLRQSRPTFLPRMATRRANGRLDYRFWQAGGGYDRNLWTSRRIHEAVAYIHENPVRRGLVTQARQWPWSSIRAWTEGASQPLPIDAESVPVLQS
jgi:putative transposase